MGGVLGKLNHMQLFCMAFVEVIFYYINIYIGETLLLVVDMGGSIFIHIFGAYFGLAVSYFTSPKKKTIDANVSATTKESDLFSMLGTLFLWMFWPSFNGGLAPVAMQSKHRCVINTILSLCSSGLTTMAMSIKLRGKFSIEDIQNATLAGGVAVGSSSDLVMGPWFALLVGMAAGFVSTLGFARIRE